MSLPVSMLGPSSEIISDEPGRRRFRHALDGFLCQRQPLQSGLGRRFIRGRRLRASGRLCLCERLDVERILVHRDHVPAHVAGRVLIERCKDERANRLSSVLDQDGRLEHGIVASADVEPLRLAADQNRNRRQIELRLFGGLNGYR